MKAVKNRLLIKRTYGFLTFGIHKWGHNGMYQLGLRWQKKLLDFYHCERIGGAIVS